MTTKTWRITRTDMCNTVPDRLVADFLEAGWKMVVWHKVNDRYKPIQPGEIIATTMPQSVYSMSNIFAHMETGEQIVIDDDKIYRLELGDSRVNVTCYGIDSIDNALQPYYNSVDDLPDWVQRKLAVLSLLDPKQINKDVENVGRRINRHVFWIYPDQ